MLEVLKFIYINYRTILIITAFVLLVLQLIGLLVLEKKVIRLQKQVAIYDRYFQSVGLAHAMTLIDKPDTNRAPKYAPGGDMDRL